MHGIEDLTLVTPTPLNGSRPGTPPLYPVADQADSQAQKRDAGKLTKVWIACGRPFSGIFRDIKARLPFYASDWIDAYNYRIIPATAMVFFSNVLPAIAFSLDLIETTGQYGVAEVLMASFVASALFSLFAAQPLVIVGVTGPITVFNKTIYDILKQQENGPSYLHFVGWVYFWAAIMHWIFAIFNGSNFIRYITLFSCDTFGFFVAWVYLQYGIQMTTRQFEESSAEAAYVSLILSLLVVVCAQLFNVAANSSLLHRHARRFLSDYGMPISVIAVSACAYWGRFQASAPNTLPVGQSFEAAGGRSWLVRFWDMNGDPKWVAVAIPFGFILFILFAFDHQVSALIAQGSEFPLKKPPGFHYDFFLLGIMTLVAGIIGVPAPNGLIPQAPIHTQSLVIKGHSKKEDEENEMEKTAGGAHVRGLPSEVPIAVVEQRVSNLVQGTLCVVLLTSPFLRLLSWIPRGVLAGLFWHMGLDALFSNGISHKIAFLLRDKTLQPPYEPLLRVRKTRIVLFLTLQLLGFGATFGVVQNSWSAIAFPVVISLLIPLRVIVLPRLPFTEDELLILDQPTASPFTMSSVGGARV